MKREVLVICLLLACSIGYSQEADIDFSKLKHIKHLSSTQAVLKNPAQEPMVPLNNSNPFTNGSVRATETGTVIGTTTYDLQTNAASFNRIIASASGEVYAVYTGAIENGWGDRGSFYNYYDGSSWGAFPTERIEAIRTGWPELIHINGKEMVFCHQAPGTELIIVNERAGLGSGTWAESPLSGILSGWWARVATDGSSYIHVINAQQTAANDNNYTLYSRSSDGGLTFDIESVRLTGIDTASGYNIMSGDSYNIAVEGSKVALVSGGEGNDLAVWISDSNGDLDSWIRTRVLDFPFENFDGNEITDIDGDMVADQIETTDGSHSILIDNEGIVHVWTGAMLMTDDDATDGNYSYFPGTSGLFYWNETMGEDSVVYIDALLDYDLSGDQFDGIGANPPGMGIGLTSTSDAAVDPATGNIYVVFSMAVENTDFFDNPEDPAAQSFRDLFGMYSTDGGLSWTTPVNLTRQSDEFTESIYPSMYNEVVNGAVHLHYMRDEEPGHALETTPDPVVVNEIVYAAFDLDAFEPFDPIADFDFNIILGSQVSFINLSDDASVYLWDFDDGLNALDENPSHIFPTENTTYNVCLTATNPYGSNEVCKDVFIPSGIEDFLLEQSVTLFPSPATSSMNIEVQGTENGIVRLAVYSLTGQKVIDDFEMNTFTENIKTIDVSGLAAGNYMLKIQTDGAVGAKQFSVVK